MDIYTLSQMSATTTSTDRYDKADVISRDFITYSIQNGIRVYTDLNHFNTTFDPFLLTKNVSYSVYSALNDRQTLFSYTNAILSTYS